LIDIVFFLISIITIEIFIKSSLIRLIKKFFLIQKEIVENTINNSENINFFLNYKKLIISLTNVIFKFFLNLLPITIFLITYEIFYSSKELFFFSIKGSIILLIISVLYYYLRTKK
jgi:hypothetical protein